MLNLFVFSVVWICQMGLYLYAGKLIFNVVKMGVENDMKISEDF